MDMPRQFLVAGIAVAMGQLGCAKILDIEEKHLAASETTAVCPLIAESPTAMRVMNAIPGSSALDVCHRKSGSKDYGKPWFKAHEKLCGAGVAFSQYTRDLTLEQGKYDFKLVAAGSACDSVGLEAPSVTIGAGESLTLMAYGSDLGSGRISLLPNRVDPSTAQPVRFVHALNNAGLLTAGMLPSLTATSIGTPLFVGVEFGKTAATSPGLSPSAYDDVDEFGYVEFGGSTVSLGDLKFGVREESKDQVGLAAKIPQTGGHEYTIFALGTMGDPRYRAKLWSCDEDEYRGAFLSCGNPKKVAVEIFKPNLTDAFTPSVVERTDPAIAAILAESTDLLCATELYDPRVVQRLKTGPSAVFDSRIFSDDVPSSSVRPLVLTPSGETPTYPAVACEAGWAENLRQWFECVKTMPGCTRADASNALENQLAYPGEVATNCMFGCGLEAARPMIDELHAGGNAQAASCYWCAITHLASYESLEHTIQKCTTEVPQAERPHVAFAGSSGIGVFSRQLSLGDPELVQLPSSGWQRAALRVPVTAENGSVFDFWCVSLRFPNDEVVLRYAGPYGTWGETGNAEELAFEAMNAISVIQERAQSTGLSAIVAIDANVGPQVLDPSTGTPLVYPLLDQIYAPMAQAWNPLVAANYVPACTLCGDAESNPLNSLEKTSRHWTSHLFGVGIDASAVVSTARTFMEPSVTLVGPTGETKVTPVSQFYGLRSVVTVTQ